MIDNEISGILIFYRMPMPASTSAAMIRIHIRDTLMIGLIATAQDVLERSLPVETGKALSVWLTTLRLLVQHLDLVHTKNSMSIINSREPIYAKAVSYPTTDLLISITPTI